MPGTMFLVPGSPDPFDEAGFVYYVVPRKSKSLSGNATRPIDLHGRPTTGRICSLLVGQGHGQIRRRNGLTVFFHRADMQEGTPFNDLQVGHTVAFELLDDRVSGPRALRVCRRQR